MDDTNRNENSLKSCADYIGQIPIGRKSQYFKGNIFKFTKDDYYYDDDDNGDDDNDDDKTIYALKVFLVKDEITNFDCYKKLFTKLINLVMSMVTLNHTAIVELESWHLFSNFDKKWLLNHAEISPEKKKEIESLPDSNSNMGFHPYLVMPFYKTSLEDIINNKEFIWSKLQFSIFIYGLIRAFSHMNSFNFIHEIIYPKKILFAKEGDYYYPKYNDFTQNKDGLISNQLDAFGKILIKLYDKKEDSDDSFNSFISKLFAGENQFSSFHVASMAFELQVIPKLKFNQDELDIFNKYKASIDNYESTHFASKKNRDSVVQLEESLKECKGNIYKAVRIMFSQKENPQASLKLALYSYSGRILPNDLVSCIQYLQYSIFQSNDAASKIFMDSLKAIKDRKPDDDVNCDEICLYYKGAFAESTALTLKLNPLDDDYFGKSNRGSIAQSIANGSSWQDELKNAITFYTRSLKKKSSPIVMGRLGAILTRFVDESDDAAGPRLLKLASDAGDVYGMVNYGHYLIHSSKNEQAKKIFERLYRRNYIDAAFTLGQLYYNEGKYDKAKEYFTKARDVFGCDKANEYVDKLEVKIDSH